MQDQLLEAPEATAGIKALSLWQPWASLVALGRKTVETRSWATSYRGPLAIHATQHCERGLLGEFTIEKDNPRGTSPAYVLRGPIAWPYRLPLGAVVATCTLLDCVPIEPDRKDLYGSAVFEEPHEGDLPHQQGGLWLIGANALTHGRPTRIEDQRPYGDFTPGRFAWLLADIEPIDPVLARGRQQLWTWHR